MILNMKNDTTSAIAGILTIGKGGAMIIQTNKNKTKRKNEIVLNNKNRSQRNSDTKYKLILSTPDVSWSTGRLKRCALSVRVVASDEIVSSDGTAMVQMVVHVVCWCSDWKKIP